MTPSMMVEELLSSVALGVEPAQRNTKNDQR